MIHSVLFYAVDIRNPNDNAYQGITDQFFVRQAPLELEPKQVASVHEFNAYTTSLIQARVRIKRYCARSQSTQICPVQIMQTA